MSKPVLYWFRRDLRLADNHALVAAFDDADGGGVLPVFVVDDTFVAPAGPTRARYLRRCLDSLSTSTDNALVVRHGDPATVLAGLAREVKASTIVATTDYGPRGRVRDALVRDRLSAAGVAVHFVDSPYVVAPGVITTKAGTPARVFSAYRRAWDEIAFAAPLPAPSNQSWLRATSLSTDIVEERAGRLRPLYFGDLPDDPPETLPDAGEEAALRRCEEFVGVVEKYASDRNLPAERGTSRLSPDLHFGVIHPRQVVARLGESSAGRTTFLSELCWRDFYADVLFHHPGSVREVLQPAMANLRVDKDERAQQRFTRWARGETGYPMVDAGMRQLLAEGWMHNRVRMVTASFLVKHLHVDWRWGARWFMWRLIDGDVASNQHGWQWTAGTGTDAAPYYRIFNPTTQAQRFDPTGDYVRAYVDELRDTPAPQCLLPGGGDTLLRPADYPEPIVDASVERDEALARYDEVRATQVSS